MVYPPDDSFWFHLRMGNQVYEQGRRENADRLAYSPEGRDISAYPPLLHYAFGYLCKLLKGLKIRVSCFQLALRFGLLVTAAAAASAAYLFDIPVLMTLLVFFSTPIIFFRILYYGFRGELLSFMCFPLWLATLLKEEWGFMAGPVFLFMIFASKTACAVMEAALYLMPPVLVWNPHLYSAFLSLSLAGLGLLVYYRQKKQEWYFPLLNALIGLFIKQPRQRYPLLHNNRLTTEEEKSVTPRYFFFLLPCLALLICCPFITGFPGAHLGLLLFWGYFLLLSLLSKRYMIYQAILLDILLIRLVTHLPAPGLRFILMGLILGLNLFFMLYLYRKKRGKRIGIYQALDWIGQHVKKSDNRSGLPPLIISWWNHGHIISGYKGYRNFWDSYFPGTAAVLKKEEIFDEIIGGTSGGLSFCKGHDLELAVLPRFRCRHLSLRHRILWESDGITVVLLYAAFDGHKSMWRDFYQFSKSNIPSFQSIVSAAN